MPPALSRTVVRPGIGPALSAVLHLAAITVAVLGLPDWRRTAATETVVPVEVVLRPAPAIEVPAETEKPQDPPEPESAAAQASEPPPPPAEEAPSAEEASPAMEPPTVESGAEEAETALPDSIVTPDVQEAARTDGAPDTEAPPQDRAPLIGRWLLEPLSLNSGDRCGVALVTGRLDLTASSGPDGFSGVLHTRVRWAHCPTQSANYRVELRVTGNDVVLVGAGFADRGTMSGDRMRLRDAYGVSVWRRQPASSQPADSKTTAPR